MEIVRGIASLPRAPLHPVLTIGNFDGVHLGHQRIIGLAVEKARARGGTAVAYTFRPHPQVALRPAANTQLLTSYDQKLEILGSLGIDLVVEEPFSREFSTISAQEFFTEILLKRLGAEAIVVGYDFAFGKGREGHLETLERLCKEAGVELTVVPPQRMGNEIPSSSLIRRHLLAGEIEAASRLLGRDFFYRGVVVKGEGRGRVLGFPTANLKIESQLTLPHGVYATWAFCESLFPGRRLPSVTNVGVRPTFTSSGELPALVETHLLDASADLYGRVLEVRFARRLREERKFAGIDSLKAQIAQDAASARAFLEPSP